MFGLSMRQVDEMSYVEIEAMLQIVTEEQQERERQAQVAKSKAGRRT